MSVVVSLQPVDERNILHIVLLSFLSDFIFSMPSKVIIIVIQFMFLGINLFRALCRAHFVSIGLLVLNYLSSLFFVYLGTTIAVRSC